MSSSLKKKKSAPVRIPRLRKPQDVTLESWQVALRRQFGREQRFRLKNIGSEPVFSEFEVTNPGTGKTYRTAIRGREAGCNYCSCPDFAVNTLGTCKHIEFMLGRLERQRGGRAALKTGFHPPYSEVFLRYGAKREVVFRPGRECPLPLRRLAQHYFDEKSILRPDRFADFEEFLKANNSNSHETRCYDDAIAFVAQVRDAERLKKRVAKMFPLGADSPAFRKLIKVPLYPYQRDGALFSARAGRSLLADDMGLGKTVEAIAAAEILARAAGVERVLVICPTSVKHQWKQEIERFSGRTAEVVEGLSPARARIYTSQSFFKITNYDIIHTDHELIRSWAPDLIILDEAQRIKNWKTRRAQAVKALASEYAIVLTGTPLENRIEELHSIVEFVDRFRLGPMFRFLAEHQHVDGEGKVIGYRNLSKISQTLEPILMRRTKDEVLKELPERLDKNLFVPMTEEQWQHHRENQEMVARIVAKWRRLGFLSDKDQQVLMIALQNMRMSCNSTYLLDQETDFGVKADEAMEVLSDMFEQEDTKAVVFSQWLRTHELLARRLNARKWDYVLFHGGVPGPKRHDLIRRFKEEPRCRLFLSTDAGGVGLNLQNAQAVINMDLPWNPAVLEQRIGRVHRLGQHRPVRIIHFVSQGTIEHGMLQVLSFKKSLFAGVLDGGKDEVFLGGTRLKKFMESVEQITTSIPEPMPTQTPETKAESPETEEMTAVQPIRHEPRPASHAATGTREQTLAEFASAGLQFVEKLCGLLTAPGAGAGTDSLLEHDEKTGRKYLRLPMPEPEALARLVDLLGAIALKR